MKRVALIGTFDTKGNELLYLKTALEENQLEVITVNCGIRPTGIVTDVSAEKIIQRTGYSIETLLRDRDKATIMEKMTEGFCLVLPELFHDQGLAGVIAIGGSSGTSIAAAGMRLLPIGVPKLIVSTMAGGDVTRFVGTSDILMMPSLVDIVGLNSVLRHVLRQAAGALRGMLVEREQQNTNRLNIAITMFGVTTECGVGVQKHLQAAGFDTLIFHANGMGGQLMEHLVEQGAIQGVVDLTTTEICDELLGGILTAGPNRLLAAGAAGIPQVVSVGAVDMVNFGSYESTIEKHGNRCLYRHNCATTLMRTTCDECEVIGREIAQKMNAGKGGTLLFPLKGVSDLDKNGQPFFDPEADKALLRALRDNIDPKKVQLIAVDAHINDPEFARMLADEMIRSMEERYNNGEFCN